MQAAEDTPRKPKLRRDAIMTTSKLDSILLTLWLAGWLVG